MIDETEQPLGRLHFEFPIVSVQSVLLDLDYPNEPKHSAGPAFSRIPSGAARAKGPFLTPLVNGGIEPAKMVWRLVVLEVAGGLDHDPRWYSMRLSQPEEVGWSADDPVGDGSPSSWPRL
jgi:hypothetical protein